jgi:hypothetical protein
MPADALGPHMEDVHGVSIGDVPMRRRRVPPAPVRAPRNPGVPERVGYGDGLAVFLIAGAFVVMVAAIAYVILKGR